MIGLVIERLFEPRNVGMRDVTSSSASGPGANYPPTSGSGIGSSSMGPGTGVDGTGSSSGR